MKKAIRFLTMPLLAGLLFASCDSEDTSPDLGITPVAFAPTISGAQATPRASGTTWTAGDAIGVFMTKAAQPVSGSNLADNVQYTYNGTKFAGTPIYYPMSGAVDFVAYYPYRATPNPDPHIYKVDVRDQTTPADIDLLYASKSNVVKSTTAVGLEFNHKLSQIVLTVAKGAGVTDTEVQAMRITIEGMPIKADFNLADGTFGTVTDITTITPRTIETGEKYEAIIIPQAADTYMARKMIFAVGGGRYEYGIPAADTIASGKSYAYTVTVKKTDVSVSQGDITIWTGTDSSTDLGEVEVEQLPIPMVLIPAGTFMMGSSDGSNINGSGLNTTPKEPNRQSAEAQHKVTLTKDFYMSKYQITNAQYVAFLNANNIGYDGKGQITYSKVGGNNPETEVQIFIVDHEWGVTWNSTENNWSVKTNGYDNYPIISVSWFGAKAYCDWLSDQKGDIWHLATEAEWEYACRSGEENRPFGIGNGYVLNNTMANFKWTYSWSWDGISTSATISQTGTPSNKTQAVGNYTPNAWGLYDMHGNVFEWCSDWHHNDYAKSGAVDGVYSDPTGPDSGTKRVLRGSGWFYDAQNCRSAYRHNSNPNLANRNIGFRVVLVP